MPKLPLPPPKPPEPRQARGSWLSIAVAITICMAAYTGLTFLTLGFFGPVLIIGGVVFAIVAFHYVVWGWWLGSVIREASDESDEDGA